MHAICGWFHYGSQFSWHSSGWVADVAHTHICTSSAIKSPPMKPSCTFICFKFFSLLLLFLHAFACGQNVMVSPLISVPLYICSNFCLFIFLIFFIAFIIFSHFLLSSLHFVFYIKVFWLLFILSLLLHWLFAWLAGYLDCLSPGYRPLWPVTLTLESNFLLLIKSRANKVCVSFCTSTIVLWLKLLSYTISDARETVDVEHKKTCEKF